MYRTEAAEASWRLSNSIRWVSWRAFLTCASHNPKGIYCGLFIEMKYGNNRQQDTQKEFLADMAAAGHFVATCYSAEEAIKVIEEYLNLALCYCPEEDFNNKMSIPNNSILKDGKVKGGRS